MKILKERSQNIYVWRNIHLNKGRIIIFLILFILALMLFIMNRVPYASIGLVMILLSYVLGIYAYRRYITWKSGSEGETLVINTLRELDDSYRMINGIVIPPNRGDTDHIIIGKNGIFVIEAKNYSGEIYCDSDVWSRYKIGRAGRAYELEIGSPSNQVKRNSKVLKDFILEHQNEIFYNNAPHIWVHGIVVFTDKNAVLKLKNPTVPVVRLDDLCNFIKEQKSEFQLSEKEIGNMCDVILKYST